MGRNSSGSGRNQAPNFNGPGTPIRRATRSPQLERALQSRDAARLAGRTARRSATRQQILNDQRRRG